MTQKSDAFQKSNEGDLLKILGTQVRFLCTGKNTAGGFSVLEVELPIGSGAPPHHHPWDEAYYILAGTIDFMLGDKTMEVTTGDFLYAPGGTIHSFSGLSDKPAKMLVFDSPADSEGFFKDVDAEVKTLPEDLEKVSDIGKRHQFTFIN